MKSRPIFIPVGSGKGGVGKSFLTANIAVALADAGHEVIAADLDLGGANLYAFLGKQNSFPGIGDFLKARTGELADLVIPTAVPRLRYLPGDGRSPFMANIPHAQKIRLISHLRRLPAEYVLLDLSAGSSFNTLDLFRLSTLGLVVTVPEFPAVINLLTFLKHALIRSIQRMYARDPAVKDLLEKAYKQPISEQSHGLHGLKKQIASEDPKAEEKIDALLRRFRPRIILNKADQPDDLKLAENIDSGLGDVLGIQGDYFGLLLRDPRIRQTVNARQIFLHHHPESPTAEAVRQIAGRIENFWQRPIDQSAQRIMERARQIYPTGVSNA